MAVAERVDGRGTSGRFDGPVAAGLPPGPRAPAIVQTIAWTIAPTWLMDRCASRLGEMFTFTFAPSGIKFVLVSDPDAVKSVFTASPDIAPSAAGNSPIRPVMGPSSVLVLTGPEHMRQRKLLLPPFHGERMREYEETIVEETRRDMASWPMGRPMRLQARTRAITLEVILRAVFGVHDEGMDPLREAIAGLLEPMNMLAILRIALTRPTVERPAGAIGRALESLDRVLYAEIARRREASDLAERADILSLLLQARDEEGAAMTDGELRDELVTLLLAGHETTATSVAWAIERLVRHPEKLARLKAEIEAGEEEYLGAVVNETLRVRPVVPIVVRQLQAELEVGGRLLPAGTMVAPCIYLTNRNGRVYERPAEFMPERFLGQTPETFSWIPFGGGIRRCIGASFAILEMKLMLRTILSELSPRVPNGWRWRRGELIRRRAITLVPVAGAQVVWEPSRKKSLNGSP
ncbi:MAG TPA: cytochrome P450 [Solirubrobacteraceae bacterium]|jgi:cytochrome P450|nr:cytochrome P450 [Solirubrobacteraceae bacterium]